MRSLILALSLMLPGEALAQTPADIARQVWPAGAPASINMAPRAGAASSGAFGPIDLARQTGPQEVGPSNIHATALRAEAGAFGPADLARARGDTTIAFLTGGDPAYRTAQTLASRR